MIKVVGYQGVSLIDFPGRIATVLFVPGCNFSCPYCQNPELVSPSNHLEPASPSEVMELLSERKNFIDGVSITGGEPTLLSDLPEFLKKIKDMGFATKVDTNGYLPKVISGLLMKNLVDFIAMDIKSSLANYVKVVRKNINTNRIQESIDLLLNSSIDYEFRTTVVPGLVTEEDIISIAKTIKGAKSYRLQQFCNRNTLDKILVGLSPFLPDDLLNMAKAAEQYVGDVKVRGI